MHSEFDDCPLAQYKHFLFWTNSIKACNLLFFYIKTPSLKPRALVPLSLGLSHVYCIVYILQSYWLRMNLGSLLLVLLLRFEQLFNDHLYSVNSCL